MFWLGFQEVSGIWARLGEKTQSLFGNANLTIAMRQQDANRTRQWIGETAGKTYVTQATSYQGGGLGEYAESRSAEVREVAGVDWRDLQSLIEGEAIILFGGRRIYAKLFHAEIDTSGPMRLNRPLPLPPPDAARLKATCAEVEAVLAALERGLGTGKGKRSATLTAMLKGFSAAVAKGLGGEACVEAAIDVAKDHPMASEEIGALVPESPLEAMLLAASRRSSEAPVAPAPAYVAVEGPAETAFADLEAIEQGAGSSRAAARKAAAMLLSAGQAIEAAPRTSSSPAIEAAAREIETLSKELRAAAVEPKGAVDEAASEVESGAPRRSAAP
jgi:intracellular multiplication protein IcmO